MHKLFCRASDCMYNAHNDCCADVIHVGNTRTSVYCDTYTKRERTGSKGPVSAIFDTEFGAAPVPPPGVSCTAARCVYNKAFRCNAKDLSIDDPHDSNMSSCGTYRPK